MSVWPNRVSVGNFLADVDAVGDFRVVTKMTGWSDGAPARSALQPKAQQDGDEDATGSSGGRVVGIEGFVERSTPEDADDTATDLAALRPRMSYTLTVDNDSIGPRSAVVRVTGSAVLDWIDDTSFTYTLQVTAPDSLRYGPQTFGSTTLASTAGGVGLQYPLAYPLDYGIPAGVTPGAISLPNGGKAAYWPRLRIDGPVPNPVLTLVETGDQIRYDGTLDAGQWLDIDCGMRRVLLNGQTSVRKLVFSTGLWLAVPVGGASLTWTADAADPAATLSAWGFEGAYP